MQERDYWPPRLTFVFVLMHVSRELCFLQDPVLFGTSIRDNLDPEKTRMDGDIWEALEQARLKDFVFGLSGQLEHEVGEGGETLR